MSEHALMAISDVKNIAERRGIGAANYAVRTSRIGGDIVTKISAGSPGTGYRLTVGL